MATALPFFRIICEQVWTRALWKKGADLSIFVCQYYSLLWSVLSGFRLLEYGLGAPDFTMAAPARLPALLCGRLDPVAFDARSNWLGWEGAAEAGLCDMGTSV